MWFVRIHAFRPRYTIELLYTYVTTCCVMRIMQQRFDLLQRGQCQTPQFISRSKINTTTSRSYDDNYNSRPIIHIVCDVTTTLQNIQEISMHEKLLLNFYEKYYNKIFQFGLAYINRSNINKPLIILNFFVFKYCMNILKI